MDNKENSKEKAQSIFKKAKSLGMKADPYLKTRVLAHVETEFEKRSSKKWKAFAILSPVALSILFVAFYFLTQPEIFKASVSENVVIRVNLEKVKSSEILYAKIDLPEGVNFYSKKHPEIMDKKSLVIAWSDKFNNGLPVIVKSNERGIKTIKISFMNEDEKIIRSKSMKVKFNGSV